MRLVVDAGRVNANVRIAMVLTLLAAAIDSSMAANSFATRANVYLPL